MQTEVLVSRKDIVKNVLEAKGLERIAILDRDCEFYKAGAPKDTDKFFLFDFNGPFQSLSSDIGLENALLRFVQEPRHALSAFKDYHKRAIADYKRLKKEGYIFNGVWMWEDIAYDKGLYFPIEKYKRQLRAMHKDMCAFFESEGLPLFFHCDGNVEALIPILAAIKVKAVHPMQERCNPNIIDIKNILKGSLTFIGGVGLYRLGQDKDEIFEYIKRLRQGGKYIFSFDGPIPENFDNNSYKELLDYIETQRI